MGRCTVDGHFLFKKKQPFIWNIFSLYTINWFFPILVSLQKDFLLQKTQWNYQNQTLLNCDFFHITYHIKGTVVNRTLSSLPSGSFKITRTLPKKGCKGKMKGGIGWNLSILGVDRDPEEFYLMFMSREIDIKLFKIYTKIYIYKIWYTNHRFKQIIFSKYVMNLKMTISQRSLKN